MEPFHANRPHLVAPVRVDHAGVAGPTPGQARGRGWRRTLRGWYVPASVELTVDQRIAEALPLLGPWSAVTGWAGLRWLGGAWFDGSTASGEARDLPVAVHKHLLPRPGFRLSQEFVRPGEIEEVDGLAVTTAARSACFEMRYASSWRRAVVALDMAAYSDLVSISEATAYAATLKRWTGIEQCRTALEHADENAWSPPEVLMRLAWTVDGDKPRPLANRPVFDREGRHLGTPDLIDPRAGVIGQYDGALHLAGRQRWQDVEKEAAFRAAGLECVTMMAGDLADPGRFVARLAAAYQRGAERPRAARGWTVTAPAWWTPTHTVDLRRALTAGQRARLLRYRRAG